MREEKGLRSENIFFKLVSLSPLAHSLFVVLLLQWNFKRMLSRAKQRAEMHVLYLWALSLVSRGRNLREIMLVRAAHKIFCLMYFYGRRNAKLIRVDIFINQMAKEVVHLRIVCDAAASAKGLLDYSICDVSRSLSGCMCTWLLAYAGLHSKFLWP